MIWRKKPTYKCPASRSFYAKLFALYNIWLKYPFIVLVKNCPVSRFGLISEN